MVQRPVFRFQIVGNRLRGKGVTHILKSIFDDSLQLVNFPNLIPLYNIGKDCRVIDIADDCIDLAFAICAQMRCRKTTQTNIICQLYAVVFQWGVLLLEG